MKVLKLDQNSLPAIIHEIKYILKNNGLVIYPTDTVYGIAANATNQEAVDKLKTFKGQRGNKPISIAVRDLKMAQQHAKLNDVAKNLYAQFLPGPLTVISKTPHQSPNPLGKGIASLEGTVGIRIIPHSFVAELFNHLDFPITATSANISNNPNPRSLEQWLKDTPQKKQAMVDVFINAGELPYAEPSTIIDTSKEDAEIVRQGTLDLAHLIARRPSHVQSFISHSPKETIDIAKQFISNLRTSNPELRTKAIIIVLQGPLGVGKTVFAQGIGNALGIREPLRSPTFTLVKEYPLNQTLNPELSPPNTELSTLYHIDAWRLSSPEELQDLGLEDIIRPGKIVIIEWPQKISELITSIQSMVCLRIIALKVSREAREIMIHTP